MTISYAGNHIRLLFKWKGSVWKSIWQELFVFLVLFYLIKLVYAFLLSGSAKETYEKLVDVFDSRSQYLPLTFLLGFYIQMIVKRWWDQFECVTWPEDVLSFVNVIIQGQDQISRQRRMTIAR